LISPHIFLKHRQADIRDALPIAKGRKPYHLFLKIVMLSVFRFSALCFTLSTCVANITLLGIGLETAIAQMPGASNPMPVGERTLSQVNVLFVNPSAGDDNGNGGERAPFKTITHALRVAQPNTVITLSRGTYSTQTGEQFPLFLKPGVSIQGDARNKGRGIVIAGGGEYLSRNFGSKNVTIVGANQAGLTGVTLTNPNDPEDSKRGNPPRYGLWIESSSPVITENTFADSKNDGVMVTGNGTPSISKNYFYRNGANGITIAGNSRTEVRENIFQQTGFGINIAQNAEPLVVGNQVQYNRAGIVVQANARPILRNNLIQGSKEDGLVILAQAMPDLGNTSEPGGNEFRNNGRYDINASAAKQLIAASGNTIASDRINGKIDLRGTSAPLVRNSALSPVSNNTAVASEITFSAPGSETRNRVTAPLLGNVGASRLNNQLMPLIPATSPLAVRSENQPQPNSKAGGFPTPSKVEGYRETATRANSAQVNYVQIDRNTIEFTAPPSPQTANNQAQAWQFAPPQPPSNAIATAPVGNNSDIQQPAPQSSPVAYSRGPSLTPNASPMGTRFRVVVEVTNERDLELVRFIAPGAFSTVWQGKTVMQAGVFSSNYNAQEMVNMLGSNGLRAVVEPLN
jgi:parallel beta-helix repeat protein